MSNTPTRKNLLLTLAAVLAVLSVISLSTGAQKNTPKADSPHSAPVAANDKQVADTPPSTADKALIATDAAAVKPAEEMKADATPAEIASYLEIYGWMVGQQAGFEMGFSPDEKAALMRGLDNAASGSKAPENMKEVFPKMQEYLSNKEKTYRAQMMAKMAEEAKGHIAEGEKFLADIAKKDGVKKTASGLYYKIEDAGRGTQPTAEDVVTINYTGKLVDGTVFDSSVERGEPADLPLYGVIPGFSEGLQLLKEGGKATLYIPSNLAYGNQAAGPIPPGSTLVFSVELIKIQPKEQGADDMKTMDADEDATPAETKTEVKK